MKKISSFFLAGMAMILCNCGPRYEGPNLQVCQWPDGRTAAISYTFDDNCPNQFATVVPMFNEFEMNATFFPVINWLGGNYDNIKAAAANGHEIGSHTVSHPNLAELTAEQVESELHISRTTIEEAIGNDYKCVTIAYPFCCTPDSIELVSNDFVCARVCDGKIDSTDVNLLKVSAHPLGTVFNATTFEHLKNIFESTRAKAGWSTLLFHEVDEGNGYSPFPSEEIRKSLEYLKENNTVFWVATMGNVARYIVERDNYKLDVDNVDGEYSVKVTVEGYDEAIFNYPISFTYTKKDGSMGIVSIVPNGEPVKLDI